MHSVNIATLGLNEGVFVFGDEDAQCVIDLTPAHIR
jgi:hypothetical protein